MPHLTIPISLDGPVIDISVWPSEHHRRTLKKLNKPIPQPINLRAIIDTGASCTVIEPQQLASLNLIPRGTTQFHTPSTGGVASTAPVYDVALILVHGQTQKFRHFESVPIISATLATHGVQALIGRDILKDCLFVYDGSAGHFSIAF